MSDRSVYCAVGWSSPPAGAPRRMTAAKRTAGIAAVDEFVHTGQVVGIGTGSTVVFAVERLAARVRAEGLQVTCVPTSFQARQLIVDAGLVLSDLNQHPQLDVAIDGADECDTSLNCIKGGGGALTQEKCVAYNADKFIVIGDVGKMSNKLGSVFTQGVPIEVLPVAYAAVMRHVRQLGGTPTLRMAKAKAGPVVTDNGNLLLDVVFESMDALDVLDQKLHSIPGVLETGLFLGMAHVALFGDEDGSLKRLKR